MESKSLVPFFIVLGLFLLFDLPVILYLNNPMYQTQFKRINKTEISLGSRAYLSAAFTYVLLALGIYVFIVRPELANFKPNYITILTKGLLLGLVVYGVYNGTNMATIKDWGLKEFIVDTAWGTVLSGTLAISSIYLIKKFGF